VIGVERAGVDSADLAVGADGGGAAVGGIAEGDRALGDRVREVAPRIDELVEVLVERLEGTAEDVPVQLLADQREVDQLDESRLQLVPHLVTVVVVEGREMCLLCRCCHVMPS
jgi:hypothetical protein